MVKEMRERRTSGVTATSMAMKNVEIERRLERLPSR
jgi:hypothetical protein